MLPLQLLNASRNQPLLIELKNGETYNGTLVSCDNWMNINLKDVICTSSTGDSFCKIAAAYIRGSMIKYMRIPDKVIDMVKERPPQYTDRGGSSDRGRGRGHVGGVRGANRGGGVHRGNRGGNRGAGRGHNKR